MTFYSMIKTPLLHKPKFLCLDLSVKPTSINLSYAMMPKSGLKITGVKPIEAKILNNSHQLHVYFNDSLAMLSRIMCKNIDIVYFNNHLSDLSKKTYRTLISLLSCWCEERSIDYMSFDVNEIRKLTVNQYIGNRRNYSQKDFFDAMHVLGYNADDDKETLDVTALLYYIRAQLDIETKMKNISF